jgi:hypothetical protein
MTEAIGFAEGGWEMISRALPQLYRWKRPRSRQPALQGFDYDSGTAVPALTGAGETSDVLLYMAYSDSTIGTCRFI